MLTFLSKIDLFMLKLYLTIFTFIQQTPRYWLFLGIKKKSNKSIGTVFALSLNILFITLI